MAVINLIQQKEFLRVRKTVSDRQRRAQLIADMCRLNTINAVKLAGSGHLGSSFSAMDIVVWLYYEEMTGVGSNDADRDIYFSSKGHDVPGQYAVLHSLGVLSDERLQRLRRLGGLDGHPDVHIPGIEANSGSLGMGISKGRGMARAKKLQGAGGRVFVLTGDGELQEGQNYEALQTTAHQGASNLYVIVDHNKLQTDRLVSAITDLGDLEQKFAAFGWCVARCDGHDLSALQTTLARVAADDRPKCIIADTIKGKGVSFMEHPPQSPADALYRWHSGAPDDVSFGAAHAELLDKVRVQYRELDLGEPVLHAVAETPGSQSAPKEYVADAYGAALVEIAERRKDIVVLDGDLAADCRVRAFEERFPERFVENGIAEQDMVSMAGGLASQGLLPVVNSFASFLAARANEQIYNNATEERKIIYACHFAGLIPAGPGKSHQSIRDISLFSALPDATILQPCNTEETAQALRYLVDEAGGTCVLRLAIGPSPRSIVLPRGYTLTRGRGVTLREGSEAVLFAYGPVMLHEALSAAEIAQRSGIGIRVVNMPWLNHVDGAWLADTVQQFDYIAVLEDHSPVGGLADRLLATLVDAQTLGVHRFRRFGVEGLAACGTPAEVLAFHQLDGESLASRILADLKVDAVFSAGGNEVDLAAYSAEAPQ